MGYEEAEITTAQILTAISDDGNKLNPLIAAEVLAAITDDDTRFSGADIAAILAASGVAAPVLKFMATMTDVDYNGRVGTWAVVSDTAAVWLGGQLHNSPGSVNDEVGIGQFYVPASGDYTVYSLTKKGADQGIIHAFINGVDLGTYDTYNGSITYNNLGSISLGTLTSGLKALSLKIATKNGSSSGYNVFICSLLVMRD